jgi:hypothetical protein
MHKGGKISPDIMLNGIGVETVFVKVVERICFGAIPPKNNMPVQFADVTERSGCGRRVYLIEIINLISYFLRYLTATFFMADEPESGMPRSISVKIIDPVSKDFFFNQHNMGMMAKASLFA